MDLNAEMNLSLIQDNIKELQEALLTAHPEMPSLLRKIHTKLKQDPALVTLLTEDEIVQVINGLTVQTNVQFASPASKTAKAAKPKSAASRINDLLKSSGVTADDF